MVNNDYSFPGGSVVNNLPANARAMRDVGSIPGSERSPEEGNDNPLQSTCLENPMDRGAWWATIHRVAKSRIWLSMHTYFYLQFCCAGYSACSRHLSTPPFPTLLYATTGCPPWLTACLASTSLCVQLVGSGGRTGEAFILQAYIQEVNEDCLKARLLRWLSLPNLPSQTAPSSLLLNLRDSKGHILTWATEVSLVASWMHLWT